MAALRVQDIAKLRHMPRLGRTIVIVILNKNIIETIDYVAS
jgi:hypothetical protein